jgi:hypothetical protein
LNQEVGLHRGEAHAWDSLGYVERQLGRYGDAADCYQSALSLFRELGDPFNEPKSSPTLAMPAAPAMTSKQHWMPGSSPSTSPTTCTTPTPTGVSIKLAEAAAATS